MPWDVRLAGGIAAAVILWLLLKLVGPWSIFALLGVLLIFHAATKGRWLD